MSETQLGEDKPFRSANEDECWDRRVPVHIRVGAPNVSPHVVPIQKGADAGKSAPRTAADFVTSFLVVWRPAPPPPPHWVKLLREAPFGSGGVHARDLHWDGHHLSIELVHEEDIEAFALEIPGWVEYANTEYTRSEHNPACDALEDAQRRARDLENRLRLRR
jgi:hypothetical protein